MAEVITKTVVELEKLGLFWELDKAYTDAGLAKKWESATFDEVTRKVSFYTVPQPSGDVEPVFTFTLPETDFTEVYNAIGTVEESVNKNKDDIAGLRTDVDAINDAETGILKQAKDYADSKDAAIKNAKDAADVAQADVDALELRMDAAEEAIDAIEADMGSIDDLQTANKTVAGAINEVLAAVGTGGTAAVVTVTSDTTTEGALKSYTIKQGDTTVGVIDIPKDMVVESGSVVTNPEGQPEGTYIKVVLANVAEPLYINVGSLVDIYTAKADATQVQISIDSSTREISATIVAGSIGSTELADGAVTTVKIADANVTLAKLSASVQASLAKADAAASQTALDEEVARAKAAEAKALEDANAHTDEKDAAMDARVKIVEGKAHEHANEEVLDGITAEKVAAWDSAEQNAKDYADGKDEAIAEAKQAGVDAATAVATLENGQVATNTQAIADNKTAVETAQADATSALEQISAIQYATEDDIRAIFA